MALVSSTINVTTQNVTTTFATTALHVPSYATGSLPTGVEGEIAYDSTTETLKVKTSAAWVTVGTQT